MSWLFDPSGITISQKERFAEAWLRNPDEPLKAVMSICAPGDSNAFATMQYLVTDQDVLDMKGYLLAEHGMRHFMPSKEIIALEILNEARKSRTGEDKARLYKLYGDFMGHIEKPGVTVNNTNNVQHNVMVVPATTNVDDWESVAAGQQSKLLADVRN